MKMKKLMSLVMASIMALALAAPALAEEVSGLDQTTTLTGEAQALTVKLTMESTVNKIVFNPYRIEVKTSAAGAIDSNGSVAGNDQIIAKTVTVKNKTNVPLKLTATFAMAVEAGTGKTAATIAKAAPAATVTAKQIYMYADFAVFDAKDTSNNGVEPDETRPEAWITASRLVGTAGTQGNDGWTGGTKHAAAGVVNIPATDGTDAGANFVYVKVDGSATAAPTEPWDGDDKVSVGIVYSFAPQASYDKYRIVATKPDANNATALFEASDAKPTFTIPYQSANITVAEGGSTAAGKSVLWDDSTTNKPIAGNILSGYQILIHCPADSDGKHYPITAVTFKNQDGTANTSVKAAKVDSKKNTSDWAFTMPAQNIQCLVTVGATAE